MATPDLDGDGSADIVWQHTDGTTAAWLMNGTAMTSGASIIGAGTGWSVTNTGDFDGDGKGDLVWTHTDGRVAIWLMNGLAPFGHEPDPQRGHGLECGARGRPRRRRQGRPHLAARRRQCGGVAHERRGDEFRFRHPRRGQRLVVAKTADFDGDGKPDLQWQHPDGRAAIWLMNGLVPSATVQILNAGGGWSAKRTGDFDGDGKADIVWENTDGSVAVWLMNGTVMSSGSGIIGPASGWSVSGASP